MKTFEVSWLKTCLAYVWIHKSLLIQPFQMTWIVREVFSQTVFFCLPKIPYELSSIELPFVESWGLESKTNNLYVMRCLSQRILQHLRQGSAPNVTWWDIFIVSTDVESSPTTNCKQRGLAKLLGENGEFRGFWVLEGFKTLESLLQSAKSLLV